MIDNLITDQKLNLVLDVKVQLTVRLGTSQMAMRDVLDLTPGAVIALDQRSSEPVGLYINDKLIARGEVVVIDDAFGIKVTELVDAA